MEISRFKKDKKNLYLIEFIDGTTIKLYDDVIVKYNLLTHKTITKEEFNEITKFNDSLDAYYISINYINKKLRSALEIRKYLEKKEYDKVVIDATIKKLKQDGYLNEKIFIESYINDALNFTYDGPNKIKYNLIKLGFNEEQINPYLNKDYTSRIKNIIDKKVKINHKLSNNNLKLNLSIYLINLGYSKEMFNDYLTNIKVNDKEMIKKDYIILIKKYQSKYDKDKLIYFIKDKLYKKGYNIEEINEVLKDELL
jgi:regulatory protein